MIQVVAPYTREERGILIDASYSRPLLKPQVVGKLRNYHVFPAFTLPNVWRGASEILIRFDFDTALVSLLNSFPITPPANANFCPVISWLKDEVYYRYKLWSDVGEILYSPKYNRQKVTADFFSIEIWNTDTTQATVGLGAEQAEVGLGNEGGFLIGLESLGGVLADLVLSQEIRFYSSRLTLPIQPYCDLNDINQGGPTSCVDPIYYLNNFEPIYGDYYLLVAPCTRQLIKGRKVKPTYNLLKNRETGTWHEIWIYVAGDGTAMLDINPADAVPPVDALGYFPIIPYWNQSLVYKFELTTDGNGDGNYFVADTTVEEVQGINVPLLQDEANKDDNHLYGFYMRKLDSGQVTFEVIQDIIAL